MEEDLTIVDDDGLTYVKVIGKDNTIKEVRAVSSNYKLKDNEEHSSFEQYKKDQENKLKGIIENAIKIEEEKKRASAKISLSGLRVDNFLFNVEEFYKIQPFFYDRSKIFWFWNQELNKYDMVDEVDIMISLENHLQFNGQTINSSIKAQYIEAFKRVGRNRKPEDAPVKWIQFKNKAFSLSSGKTYEVTPDYFFTNPIPWELSDSPETPVIDKLFEEWVGKKYVQTVYEILAYCCYRSYPIQTLFCLYGSGRNGKSQFLKILNRFLGTENTCSTELDTLLDSRFEAFKLYKKLACSLGETNFGVLKKTSLLKKLVGGDLIGYEKKGKDPFDEYNYSKILIASNSLPSSDDTSEGFYRRWLIIDFPNSFKEGKDIVETIPKQEYNNLAVKVTQILPKLLDMGNFTNQGDIEERKHKYILASNPLPIFIKKCCVVDESSFISYNQLYTEYVKFLLVNKNRKVKMGEFKAALETEGFWVEKTSKRQNDESFRNGNWVIGIKLKESCDNCDNYASIPTPNPYRGDEVETGSQKAQLSQNEEFVDDMENNE